MATFRPRGRKREGKLAQADCDDEGTELQPHRFLRSALTEDGSFLTTREVETWVAVRAADNYLSVERVPLANLQQWSFEPATGDLVHRSGKFFRVHGARVETSLGR